jgi:hypothetical protein
MMAATRSSWRKAGKPPEDQSASRIKKISEKLKNKKREKESSPRTTRDDVEETEEAMNEAESEKGLNEEALELPYSEVVPLPVVSRTQKDQSEKAGDGSGEKAQFETETGFKNQAPLQADERAKLIIQEALRNPIGITTEDLLSISEPARQELRRLVTKRRLEKKSVTFVAEPDQSTSEQKAEDTVIRVEKLPDVSYEIQKEEIKGVPKGALVIGDPVVQYLSTLRPGEQPKKVVVAMESQGLKAIYPLINGVGEVESLLDSGSQIVSMDKEVACDLEISWDPDITVHMQSANKTMEQSLGLAKNVPFVFGPITVYLQVHVMEEPAYKVLLGRPFDTVTESLVKNTRDGSQNLTLTDPNTGERCVLHTHERGRPPRVIKKPRKEDFQ